jgi:hypothetical protein
MIAEPKKSESKAKTIAGQLPNRLPMRDSALGAASGLCAEARCSISSPNHEIALFEIPAALRSSADDLSPESIDVCSRKGHLNQPTVKGTRLVAHDVDRCERAFAMASSLASTVISSICARSLRWRLSRRSRLIRIQI